METTSFHNSIGESGQLLINYENNAKAQEAKILDYLTALPALSFTRDELFNNLFAHTKVPVSSVGRALTNLFLDDKLTVTGKRMGTLGKNQNCYKILLNNVI